MFLKFDRQLVNVQNIRTIDEVEDIDGKKTVRISFKNDEYIIVNMPFDVVWETLRAKIGVIEFTVLELYC